MSTHSFAWWLVVSMLIWAPTGVRAGDMKAGDWALLAPVEMAAHTRNALAECALTPEVLDASLPDLRDLRVVVHGNEEIPFVIKTNQGSVSRVPLQVRLYNRTCVADRESTITADFGKKELKNRVRVMTPGTNFRRKVRVEGSDNGETWMTVREGAFLFRIQHADAKSQAYEGNVVSFPDNDLRYLKITVCNAEDDKGALEITDVKAFKHVRTPAETVAVSVMSTETVQEKRRTDITLDLGYRNLPLHELKVDFSDPNFLRTVAVWGRDQETRVVRRVVEDSAALERTVQEPWSKVIGGTIHRFSAEKSADESLSLNLRRTKFRYLQIRIENRDDPPLSFTGARVFRLAQTLEFPTAAGGHYDVLTGYAKAIAPVYDLGHYIDRLRPQGVAHATLGKIRPNPLHTRTERTIPWSERHEEILWLALLAMAAALGFLVYRLAMSARITGAETEAGE
jgi:hypothetical protein